MAAHRPFLRAAARSSHSSTLLAVHQHAAEPPAAPRPGRPGGGRQPQADPPEHTRGIQACLCGPAQPPAGGGREGESGRGGCSALPPRAPPAPRPDRRCGCTIVARRGCSRALQPATSHCAARGSQGPPPRPRRRARCMAAPCERNARAAAPSSVGGGAAARAAAACWCLCVHVRAAARRLADRPAALASLLQVVGIDLGEFRGARTAVGRVPAVSCLPSILARPAAYRPALICLLRLQAPPTAQWRRWRVASPPSSPTQRAAAPPPLWWPSPRPATASWARCGMGRFLLRPGVLAGPASLISCCLGS